MKLDIITNNRENKKDNDEFYTPNYAIIPIEKYLKRNSKIWCPFDTDQSNYIKFFTEMGHNVFYTHLDNGDDFFEINAPKNIDYIISNPPYSLKIEVFKRLFELKIPFAMLVGVVGLFESQKRFNLFKENEFEIMYFNKRISYFRNYNDQKPSLNPPFSSVYITQNILPKTIIFEEISK